MRNVMPLRAPLFLMVLALLPMLAGRSARAQEEDLRAVEKDLKKAFKRLDLQPEKQLKKFLAGHLPTGIVTDAAPFDALISQLMRPHAERLAARRDAVVRLRPHASPAAARMLSAAFKSIAKEMEGLRERTASVEAAYAEVFNADYMAASETTRRTRKGAAVLIPFYRKLLFADAALVSGAADVFADMTEGEGLLWLTEKGVADAQVPIRVAVVEALGRIRDDAAREALVRVLSKDRVSTVRGRALGALFRWPVVEMREPLIDALGDPAWEVRALAIAACRQARLLDAVGPLIRALDKEEGRLQTDIDDALYTLVGVRMYADVEMWRTWWKEHGEETLAQSRERESRGVYDDPLGPVADWPESAESEGVVSEERGGGTTAFYGIETRSRRVLFVVDISFSMGQATDGSAGGMGGGNPHGGVSGKTKLEMAKEQLRDAIKRLPDGATCNLVVYSESYAVWEEGMVPLKSRTRKKVDAFINTVTANGTTNICDALDRALELAGASPLGLPGKASDLAADTLFLLSDGDPNRGRLSQLNALLDDFLERNLHSRIVVHTIGIGEAAGSEFLKTLARKTGGRYVDVR